VQEVREDPELACDAHIVAIRADAVRDDAGAYLTLLEGLDHALLGGHARDPAVGHDGHAGRWRARGFGARGGRGRYPTGVGGPSAAATISPRVSRAARHFLATHLLCRGAALHVVRLTLRRGPG